MLPKLDEMTVPQESTLRQALETIARNAQRIVFVVDSAKRLAGVLSDGDIRRALLVGKDLNAGCLEVANRKFTSRPVATPNHEILALLSEKLTHIPLVDDDGILVDYACMHKTHRIPVMNPFLNGNESNYVMDCLRTNWISSQGKYVTTFEEMFGKVIGTEHTVAVSNGTVALHLAMLALDIGPGDEVIVPNLTFAASINTVIHAGATPVLVDVSRDTWCIDPAAAERAITPRTKAIMPVHLYGQPCRMDELSALAKKHKLVLIEDAAEAMGSTYKGKMVGVLGDAACFSFFGNKMVTTGEGGMVVFRTKEQADRARMLRDHGMSKERRYWHLEVGYNYRLTNLQAAIGVAQLEQWPEILERKAKICGAYRRGLSGIDGLILPPEHSWSTSVYWLFTVLLDEKKFGPREEVIRHLLANGIETRPVFFPLSHMPPYQKYATTQFPESEFISQYGLSLPSSVTLSERETDSIIKNMRELGALNHLITDLRK